MQFDYSPAVGLPHVKANAVTRTFSFFPRNKCNSTISECTVLTLIERPFNM